MKLFKTLLIVVISVAGVKAQERQPFYLHINNLIETLEFIGAPLSEKDKVSIQLLPRTAKHPSHKRVRFSTAQNIFPPSTLIAIIT